MALRDLWGAMTASVAAAVVLQERLPASERENLDILLWPVWILESMGVVTIGVWAFSIIILALITVWAFSQRYTTGDHDLLGISQGVAPTALLISVTYLFSVMLDATPVFAVAELGTTI